MSRAVFQYRPLPVFEPFHADARRSRLIVGGYGSGKSHALCAEAIALGLEQPGSEFLVMRKTVPALKTTTEKIFLSLLPPEFHAQCEEARAGGHLDYIRFPNGSLYYFRGCADWRRHNSMNLAFIVWDEVDEFDSEDFTQLQARLRQVHPTPQAKALGHTKITRNGNIAACNPRGRNWIWEFFVDPENANHVANSSYYVSTSFDNPYLPRATLEDWLAKPDQWVRRYVLSSFDSFAGAIYPEWNYDTHVVPSFKDANGRYKYPAGGWFRMGFDPGTHAGNAGLWVFYDKAKHRFVGVAEYNETGLSAAQHATAWRRIEATHGMRSVARLADPGAINNRDRGSNSKLSDLYRRLGFMFQLGPSRVDDRVWALGELIAQGRFVLTEDCPRTHSQILGYRWEDLTPRQVEAGREAKPLKKDVDLVDAAQYAVSRYVPPPPVEPMAIPEEDQHAIDVSRRIKNQIKRKQRRNARSGGPSGNVPV